MQTLVIHSQYKENYGDEQNPYWKFKGGTTYFVNDITDKQVNKIIHGGIPTLTNMIEYNNGMSEEYIIDWEIRQLGKDGDGKGPLCDHWETPVQFRWGGDRWLAQTNHTPRDEDNFWARGIVSKAEQWIPLPNNERSDYQCQFKTKNGWFDQKDAQLLKDCQEAA